MIGVWLGVFTLALFSSYQDIREKRVHNGLIGGIVGYALGLALVQGAVESTLVNASIALFLGLVLWWSNVWAEGDAKLFVAYATLIPVSLNEEPIRMFPLLVNTILPMSVAFLVQEMMSWSFEDMQRAGLRVITTILSMLLGYGIATAMNSNVGMGIGFLPIVVPMLRYAFAIGGVVAGGMLWWYNIPFSREWVLAIVVAAGAILLQTTTKRNEWRAGAPWLALGAILTLFLGSTVFSLLF